MCSVTNSLTLVVLKKLVNAHKQRQINEGFDRTAKVEKINNKLTAKPCMFSKD